MSNLSIYHNDKIVSFIPFEVVSETNHKVNGRICYDTTIVIETGRTYKSSSWESNEEAMSYALHSANADNKHLISDETRKIFLEEVVIIDSTGEIASF